LIGQTPRPAQNGLGPQPGSPNNINPFERHYRPIELAELWGFGVDKIREWFTDQPGILIEDRPETLNKRGYRSMRIPASVAEKVYREHLATKLRRAA
jgi:hypothetical protein